MSAFDLLGLIINTNPAVSEIKEMFNGFSGMPHSLLNVVLKSLDEELLKKMATWSVSFAEEMNKISMPEDPGEDVTTPDYNEDFLDAVGATKWKGKKLTWAMIEEANNKITKAIKAENWEAAVLLGIRLAGGVPA